MTDLIERELELAASPEAVWRALTDRGWLESWLADEVALELVPGGDAHFMTEGRVRTGWVEEVTAPSSDAVDGDAARLAFWWAEDEQPASRVAITLTATEHGTRLRVVEARPLEVFDLVGIPTPRQGGSTYGPALVAA